MSTTLTPKRVEAGFWLLLLSGLALGIGLETDWGRKLSWPISETAVAPQEFPKPVLSDPFRHAAPEQYLEITMRPLFVVTRRPAPPAPPPEAPRPAMVREQFVLMGTTIVPEGKFAFLLEKAGNKSRVVAEGKEINGILVKEVTAERVVLTQHGDMEVLVLKTGKAPGTPVGAAPGAARGVPVAPAPQGHAFPPPPSPGAPPR